MRRKFILRSSLIIMVIFIFISCANICDVVSADSQTEEELISDSVTDELTNIDTQSLDELFSSLDDYGLMEDKSVYEKIVSIINGEYFNDYTSLFSALVNLFFGSLNKYIPLIISIFVIIILSQLIHSFKSDKSSKSISNVIDFISFALIIILLSTAFKNIIEITESTLSSLKNQIDIVFPILLSMLTALGSIATVSIYKPIMVLLSGSITIIFKSFLYPLFILAFLFVIIGNISSNVKLQKFNDLISSIFKWSVGLIFTIFSGILTIQGISAGKYDNISITATRFALKSYIPLIGGYLSDGLDYIVLSSILIKNSVGLIGIILVFISIISPILFILSLKFGLQLLSACIEPMNTNSNVPNFINQCSKILIYPLIIILAVSFMYILSLGLVMCTANLV